MFLHLEVPDSRLDSASSSEKERVLESLDNVFRSYRERDHFLSSDDASLQRLRCADLLSKSNKSLALDLIRNSAALGGVRKKLAFYVKAVPLHGVSVSAKFGAQEILTVDLNCFERSRSTQKAALVCEHFDDCVYYQYLGAAAAYKAGLGGVRVSFEHVLGGGSTIGIVFTAYCRLGLFVLAVADSDIRYPGGGAGSTARALRAGTSVRDFQRRYILKCRAVENLFSHELVFDSLAPHKSSPSIPDVIYQAGAKFGGYFSREHFDFKNGLRLFGLQKKPKNESKRREQAYWTDFCGRLCPSLAAMVCSCADEDHCACILLPGCGDSLLPTVGGWIKAQLGSRRQFDWMRYFGPTLQSHQDLADMLLAWGCAPPGVY